MPTYEYRCANGHTFERFFRSISAAAAEQSEAACPECGRAGERMISAGAALLFKGSGFYITDYGKDGKKDQRTAAKAADGASAGGADAPAAAAPAGGESKAASESKPASGSTAAGETKAAPAPKPAAESKPAAPPKNSGPRE